MVIVPQEWISYGNGFARHIVVLTKLTTKALSLFYLMKLFAVCLHLEPRAVFLFRRLERENEVRCYVSWFLFIRVKILLALVFLSRRGPFEKSRDSQMWPFGFGLRSLSTTCQQSKLIFSSGSYAMFGFATREKGRMY